MHERTTLDIDAELTEEAVRLYGRRTKAAAVEAVLQEYVLLRRKEILLSERVRLEGDRRASREAELEQSRPRPAGSALAGSRLPGPHGASARAHRSCFAWGSTEIRRPQQLASFDRLVASM